MQEEFLKENKISDYQYGNRGKATALISVFLWLREKRHKFVIFVTGL